MFALRIESREMGNIKMESNTGGFEEIEGKRRSPRITAFLYIVAFIGVHVKSRTNELAGAIRGCQPYVVEFHNHRLVVYLRTYDMYLATSI